jgi:hypothetical protein
MVSTELIDSYQITSIVIRKTFIVSLYVAANIARGIQKAKYKEGNKNTQRRKDLDEITTDVRTNTNIVT